MIVRRRSPARPFDASADIDLGHAAPIIRRGPYEARGAYVGSAMVPVLTYAPKTFDDDARARMGARPARTVCGALMPLARKTCILIQGHVGFCKSVPRKPRVREPEHYVPVGRSPRMPRFDPPGMVQARCSWCQMFPCECSSPA